MRKAIIIGSGIAGTTLALQLKRIGVPCTIYESEEMFSNIGLFIYISPNGMNVFQSLGIYEKIKNLGIVTTKSLFHNEKAKQVGRLLYDDEEQRYGAHNIVIKRSLLYKALREEAINQGIKIEFGKKLIDIEILDPEKVRAHFADKTSEEGTFLIGCDGIRSTTRKIILPNAPKPQYNGIIVSGGFSKVSIAPHVQNTFYSYFLNGSVIAHVTSKENETYWWQIIPYPDEPTREELKLIPKDDWKQKLIDLCNEIHPVHKKFIEEHEGDFLKIPIYDIDFLPTWHKGPVCLTGDAAHPSSPHLGQGASMALEDSIVLAKCLRDIPNTHDAFVKFQSLRKERTEKLVKFARESGAFHLWKNPIRRLFRDLLMSLTINPFFQKHAKSGSRFSMDTLFGYKVDWDNKISQ